jgi:hypothetical protein
MEVATAGATDHSESSPANSLYAFAGLTTAAVLAASGARIRDPRSSMPPSRRFTKAARLARKLLRAGCFAPEPNSRR